MMQCSAFFSSSFPFFSSAMGPLLLLLLLGGPFGFSGCGLEVGGRKKERKILTRAAAAAAAALVAAQAKGRLYQ
jgi:hypothetical protein